LHSLGVKSFGCAARMRPAEEQRHRRHRCSRGKTNPPGGARAFGTSVECRRQTRRSRSHTTAVCRRTPSRRARRRRRTSSALSFTVIVVVVVVASVSAVTALPVRPCVVHPRPTGHRRGHRRRRRCRRNDDIK